MPYASARPLRPDSIPLIDLTPLRDNSDTTGVSEQLYKASTGLGFIYVTGHGIADDVINCARQAAYAFFRSPETQKRQVMVSPQHRGWLKPGEASMHDKARPDLKESFIWGHEHTSGSGVEEHPLRGPNQWPSWIPGMPSAAMEYFRRAEQLALDLMRGFALGLQLPENFFLRSCAHPLSRGSLVYYPAQHESCGEDQFGVAAHTDFGMLTLLCQDNNGGLQVQDISGEWLEAPPIEGTLVVNVGDLLSRWTAGTYKSTPHRVINSSGNERLSLVLAFDPDPHTLVDASEIAHATHSHEPLSIEPAITCGDYLMWRFEKAFSYRRNST